MQTMIQKAIAGQRKAMEYLYDSTKSKVFYVSKLLLQSEELAESATIWVYRFGWSEIKILGIETEEEFLKLVMQRAVGYCKKRILKSNPKAFHMPINKNFNMNGTAIPEKTANVEEVIFSQFTDLQRFILVLHTAAGYEMSEVAKVVNLKPAVVELALEAEKKNVKNILNSQNLGEQTNYKKIVSSLTEKSNWTLVPERVDTEVYKVIGYIVEPIEKKKKKQRNMIISTIAIVCILLIGIGKIGSMGQKADSTTETESESETEITSEITSETETESASDTTLTE